jgi:hypothetical protein
MRLPDGSVHLTETKRQAAADRICSARPRTMLLPLSGTVPRHVAEADLQLVKRRLPVLVRCSLNRTADGLFASKPIAPLSPRLLKIDRSMPIVAETEQIPNRRQSPLNSRAQISDGLGARCLSVDGNNFPY